MSNNDTTHLPQTKALLLVNQHGLISGVRFTSNTPDVVFGEPEVVRIKPSGEVVIAEGANLDDAARAFWNAITEWRGDGSRPTLADAQPGGRVRLGDALPPLPPMGYEVRGTGMGPHDVYYTPAAYTAEQMQDYARAALSAQPSPGGQGAHDCLASTLGDLFLRGWIDDVSGKLIAEAARKDMAAALAARQPVMAVPQGCHACDRTGIRQSDEGRNICCPDCDLGRACAGDAGQPVGEPTIWVSPAQLSAHKDRIPGDGGAYLPARLTRDGQFTKPLYAAPAQAVDLAPRPMDTAPTDGTLVRLLVDFTSNATEDTSGPAWTIGSNNDSNVMADERVGWQFAGWCWTHDHFTEGEGTPVGWLPLVGEAAQAVDLGSGIAAIADERQRQLQAEGFTREKDQQYRRGELAKAATAYVQLAAMDLEAGTRDHIAWHGPAAVWPWAREWWKPVDARRDLVRAGALIAAQIDLIDSHAGVTRG
ncbi:TPA: hypothetical protein ACKP5X_000581 [Stenotrophomonas maltophilia]